MTAVVKPCSVANSAAADACTGSLKDARNEPCDGSGRAISVAVMNRIGTVRWYLEQRQAVVGERWPEMMSAPSSSSSWAARCAAAGSGGSGCLLDLEFDRLPTDAAGLVDLVDDELGAASEPGHVAEATEVEVGRVADLQRRVERAVARLPSGASVSSGGVGWHAGCAAVSSGASVAGRSRRRRHTQRRRGQGPRTQRLQELSSWSPPLGCLIR